MKIKTQYTTTYYLLQLCLVAGCVEEYLHLQLGAAAATAT